MIQWWVLRKEPTTFQAMLVIEKVESDKHKHYDTIIRAGVWSK